MQHRGTKDVINISSGPARFELAGNPGTAPTVVELEPGEVTAVPAGYAVPIDGRKSKSRPAAVEALTMRNGKPQVVALDDPRAKAAIAKAEAAKGKAKK